MDALILSCSTGGGHNAAGYAVMEELKRRGHSAVMLDPYTLAGGDWDKKVGDGYVRLVQKSPLLFGMVYQLGDWYRRLPIHSPVYRVNQLMWNRMRQYLEQNHYDVILMPHVYPGEILTGMKNQGVPVPKTIFIATDYVCIPFTEEIDCDYYVTPAPELNADFIRRGLKKERLVPCGIPVRRAFLENISRSEAAEQVGLDESKRYYLLSGGSIGVGQNDRTMDTLLGYLADKPDGRLIVVCGSNRNLYDSLTRKYGGNPQVIILGVAENMAAYMHLCEVFISKPGGLSSTEAAVSGTPLIHISPIPGCETHNMEYFSRLGMSISAENDGEALLAALKQLENPETAEQMRRSQKAHIPALAAENICRLAESAVSD